MAWTSISRQNICASASRFAAALLAGCLLVAPAVTSAQPSPAPAASDTAPLALARFIGKWDGKVLYRNVLTGEMSELAATMTGKSQGKKVLLDMLLDNGKGQMVRQPFTIDINAYNRTFTRDPGDEAVTLRIASGELAPKAADPLALVLEARSSEQAVPVDLRETIEIAGDNMTWKREMKHDGGTWGFRSEYRLTRNP